MLDPLSTLGVVANVIQVVDFGIRVIDKGKELAQNGITNDQQHLLALAADTERVCRELKQQIKRPCATPEGSEKAILDVASRTKDVADKLEDLLSSLSISDPAADDQRTSKRRRVKTTKVAKSVWKGVWKEEEVSRLKRTMLELQQDMVLRLVAFQTASLSTLTRSIETIAGKLESERIERLKMYEKFIPEIGGRMTASIAGKVHEVDRDGLMEKLHEFAKQVRTIDFCQRVLETLSFEDIHRRQDDIPAAHQRTFEWIFDPQTTDFSDWLSKKGGMYWITGKPGSGKSTLMKFIIHHQRTNTLLRQWSGSDEIIIASHFFWIPGSSRQRSQEGLLRTLLFNIIQQAPEWAHELVPPRFQSGRSGLIPWTYDELRTTIQAFAQKSNGKTKLCLFIDGLDEYKGEHTDLIELIAAMGNNPQLKICVASRPWNVFSRAYHQDKIGHLEVHHLTEADIKKYITDTLTENPLFASMQLLEKEGCVSLISNISAKAQGVFLWVALVVRSLLRGVDNDDDLSILQRRLDEYPSDLEEYFWRMFNRIESVYWRHSARILLTAFYNNSLAPFWYLKCLDIEMQNPDYSLHIKVPPSPLDAIRYYGCDRCGLDTSASTARNAHLDDSYERPLCEYLALEESNFGVAPNEEHQRRSRRLLDARAADLLEVAPNGGIEFVHRTAYDFIAESEALDRLHERAGQYYDVGLSLARLRLAKIKLWTDEWYISNADEMAERLAEQIDHVWAKNMDQYSALFHEYETVIVPFYRQHESGVTVAQPRLPEKLVAFRAQRAKDQTTGASPG